MQSQLQQLEKDEGIEWQKFNLEKLFGKSTRGRRLKSADRIEGSLPFVTAGETDEGISAFIGNKVTVFSKNTVTIDMFGSAKYRGYQYGADDHVAVVHTEKLSPPVVLYLTAAIHKSSHAGQFDYSRNFYARDADALIIQLPTVTQNGESKIAFDFIEKFLATLDAERLATLDAYLKTTGLKDYALTAEEQTALDALNTVVWGKFNLENLYGKSSRGRRLKSAERVEGELPFVTAGETDTGISAWIGNDVHIYLKNTVTIDMFGSAKYRNYDYGADDHVAVVHTEALPKFAALYLTAAIHKSSHAGQFDYSRNFYASDADELNLSLPLKKDKTPDYQTMSLIISAMQKVVIKNVVNYLDVRIEKTDELVSQASHSIWPSTVNLML